MRIENRLVPTARITQNVLSVADGTAGGETVLFVHGNVSSSAFWRDTLLALAEAGHRPLAVDLRGFGDTEPAPVDATRGLRDYSDDLLALVDALGTGRRAPGRLEHGRRGGPAGAARPAGRRTERDAGQPGLPVRLRRHARPRRAR